MNHYAEVDNDRTLLTCFRIDEKRNIQKFRKASIKLSISYITNFTLPICYLFKIKGLNTKRRLLQTTKLHNGERVDFFVC